MIRRLRWRLWRGRKRLDLVEEVSDDGELRYLGLLDGDCAVVADRWQDAGIALIRSLVAQPAEF